MTPHLLRELTTLLISNVAGRRADEPRHAVLLMYSLISMRIIGAPPGYVGYEEVVSSRSR